MGIFIFMLIALAAAWGIVGFMMSEMNNAPPQASVIKSAAQKQAAPPPAEEAPAEPPPATADPAVQAETDKPAEPPPANEEANPRKE
ncbi:MAG TPA: hypothetical protein VI279_09450 [Rhodocyclaceae bacterium]